jgi:hypothetical protein
VVSPTRSPDIYIQLVQHPGEQKNKILIPFQQGYVVRFLVKENSNSGFTDNSNQGVGTKGIPENMYTESGQIQSFGLEIRTLLRILHFQWQISVGISDPVSFGSGSNKGSGFGSGLDGHSESTR